MSTIAPSIALYRRSLPRKTHRRLKPRPTSRRLESLTCGWRRFWSAQCGAPRRRVRGSTPSVCTWRGSSIAQPNRWKTSWSSGRTQMRRPPYGGVGRDALGVSLTRLISLPCASGKANRLIILVIQRSFIPRRATGFRVSLRLFHGGGMSRARSQAGASARRVGKRLAACNTLASRKHPLFLQPHRPVLRLRCSRGAALTHACALPRCARGTLTHACATCATSISHHPTLPQRWLPARAA